MTTPELRELVGVSPVTEQSLPPESKHDLDKKYDEYHELVLDKKTIRLLNGNEIMPFAHQLSDILWNPKDTIKEQLKNYTAEGSHKLAA